MHHPSFSQIAPTPAKYMCCKKRIHKQASVHMCHPLPSRPHTLTRCADAPDWHVCVCEFLSLWELLLCVTHLSMNNLVAQRFLYTWWCVFLCECYFSCLFILLFSPGFCVCICHCIYVLNNCVYILVFICASLCMWAFIARAHDSDSSIVLLLAW